MIRHLFTDNFPFVLFDLIKQLLIHYRHCERNEME
jgi:hypothetical protein